MARVRRDDAELLREWFCAVSTREVEAQQQMTEYVVTRWYRAPELILTRSYTESIDIWAAGCILAEMLGRKPIFPGKDYMDQISKIIGVVGTPSKADMSHISGKRAKAYIAGLGEMATVPWSTLYPKASETALDLLDKCLTFNPCVCNSAQSSGGPSISPRGAAAHRCRAAQEPAHHSRGGLSPSLLREIPRGGGRAQLLRAVRVRIRV